MGRTRNSGGRDGASRQRTGLDDVRKLQLRYRSVRPEEIELAVVYVGGQVKVFEVDRLLIEALLERLEQADDEEKA
jgi:hypothetical protein